MYMYIYVYIHTHIHAYIHAYRIRADSAYGVMCLSDLCMRSKLLVYTPLSY